MASFGNVGLLKPNPKLLTVLQDKNSYDFNFDQWKQKLSTNTLADGTLCTG